SERIAANLNMDFNFCIYFTIPSVITLFAQSNIAFSIECPFQPNSLLALVASTFLLRPKPPHTGFKAGSKMDINLAKKLGRLVVLIFLSGKWVFRTSATSFIDI